MVQIILLSTYCSSLIIHHTTPLQPHLLVLCYCNQLTLIFVHCTPSLPHVHVLVIFLRLHLYFSRSYAVSCISPIQSNSSCLQATISAGDVATMFI